MSRDRLARILFAGVVLLAAVVASPRPADAQRGIWVSQAGGCTGDSRLTSPITGETYCFDQAANVLKRWTGSAWSTMTVSAVPIVGADGGTGVVNTGFSLSNPTNCATIVGPVAGKTLCFDQTANRLKGWNGTYWLTMPIGSPYYFDDFGAVGDGGTTDNAAALNAGFAQARADAINRELVLPCGSSYYQVLSSVNAGGFGNAPPTVRGCGSKNTGSRIHGKFSTAGQAVFDFSGNEGGQIIDLTIEGDSTTTPDIGLLMAGATVGGVTRGGVNYLQNVQVAGTYNKAAIVVRSADLNIFNHVIAGMQVPSGTGGVVLYVVNGSAVTPAFTIASAFRTLSDATGLTSFSSMNSLYTPAGNIVGGTQNRAAWLVEGVSGVVNSVNDTMTYGGITATAIEYLKTGNALNVSGIRHEAGGGSFIKTDGFKNSYLAGNVQKVGATVLIDTDASYGTGNGIITNSTIRLGASGTGANLFNTASANTGLLNNEIFLTDTANLIMSAGQTGGNTIYNYDGTGTVTLNSGYVNTILTHGKFQASGLSYDGTAFVVTTLGPHAIGGTATEAGSLLLLKGTRTSAGDIRFLDILGDIQPGAGFSAEGINVRPTFRLLGAGVQSNYEGIDIRLGFSGAGGTVSQIDGIRIQPFAAPAGTGMATLLYLQQPPTVATTNLSMWVASGGISRFDGALAFNGNTAGASGTLMQSSGASTVPAYTTATYPATATGTGTILRADGTNWVATTATYPTTTTANQLLYSTATNVVGGSASLTFDGTTLAIAGSVLQFTDSALSRTSANILDLKNGTVAQTFRVYATTASAGAYLELAQDGAGNAYLRAPSGAGATNLILAVESNNPVYIRTNAAYRWLFDGATGDMQAQAAQRVTLGTVLQANLGTPANGSIVYCSDCNTASACTAGGTGALASRQAGAWKCL